MKNIISITEARKDIFDIAEKVQKAGNHYIFTENGKAKLAVMSAEEYENLMEDLALASDPKFRARIKQSEEDFRTGNYVTLSQLEKELGFTRNNHASLVMDKSKKVYRVGKNKKK